MGLLSFEFDDFQCRDGGLQYLLAYGLASFRCVQYDWRCTRLNISGVCDSAFHGSHATGLWDFWHLSYSDDPPLLVISAQLSNY